MKNKKLTYILLLSVLVVWILVFGRIFNLSKDSASPSIQQTAIAYKIDTFKQIDTFKLIANYADPFLSASIPHNNRGIKKHTVKKSNIEQKKVDEKIETKIEWPVIEFEGLIRSETKVQGLLNIDELQHIVAETMYFKDVYIEKIFRDSIRVTFKDQTKTYFK